MDCYHKNTEIKSVNYSMANLSTRIDLPVCNNCGAEIWSGKHRKEINSWLYKNKEISLRVEGISHNEAALERLAAMFAVDKSTIIRACVAVYSSKVVNNDALLAEVLANKKEYSHDSKVNVRVSPALAIKIKGYSSLFNMPVNQFCSVGVDTILSALEIESKKEIKE